MNRPGSLHDSEVLVRVVALARNAGLLLAAVVTAVLALSPTAMSSADAAGTYTTIALRAVASNNNGTGSAGLAIGIPAGAVAGDVLVAQIAVAGTTPPGVTAPAGWIPISSNSGSGISSLLYYHEVGSTEPASYTWSFSVSVPASGGIGDFSGVNSTSPLDTSSGVYDTTGATSMTAPSVNTTTPADELLYFGALPANESVTPPSGMSGQWSAASSATTSYMASQLLASEGATGSRVGTAASTGFSNVSQLVALRPGVSTSMNSVSFVQAQALSPGTKMTSEKITFTKPVQRGDLLVGWFAQYNAAGQVSVTDNVNGAWTRSASETFTNGGGDLALYYKLNSAAAPSGLTITVSAATATYLPYAVADYTGLDSAAALDKVAVASLPSSAKSTQVKAGPTASVPAGELVFGGEITGGIPASFTVGSSDGVPFVKRATNIDSGSTGVEDILSSAAGPQNSSFTISSATDWYSVVATFTP